MVVKPGESFKLPCKITGYTATGSYTNWVRHASGKTLEWIGWYYSSSDTGSINSLKNKIHYSAEASSNTVILHGQNFQAEDTAVYYCFNPSLPDSYGQSLISSASVLKRPGESVTVSCSVSGFSVSGFYMSWIRQKPGQELEWIGYINEGTRTWFAQSLQGRVSITKDNNKNILYLEVKCLKAEDTAVYYCARRSH
ncbi:hypothetical protein C0J45_12998 [Silurus meridionalis]|nr:hypothetical protein C0J45_12998 [Silurus meridionalis]